MEVLDWESGWRENDTVTNLNKETTRKIWYGVKDDWFAFSYVEFEMPLVSSSKISIWWLEIYFGCQREKTELGREIKTSYASSREVNRQRRVEERNNHRCLFFFSALSTGNRDTFWVLSAIPSQTIYPHSGMKWRNAGPNFTKWSCGIILWPPIVGKDIGSVDGSGRILNKMMRAIHSLSTKMRKGCPSLDLKSCVSLPGNHCV